MTTEKKRLNPKWEKFCRLFASDEEYFGNGAKSYQKVYSTPKKPVAYKTAIANASRLLTNADILKRIDELLEKAILNDSFVDKQLGKLITQDADFKSKLGAIKEYNQLKQRIQKKIDRFEKDGHITEYENLSDEELNDELKKRENRISKAS